MNKEDWNGDIFTGTNIPVGYRISILDSKKIQASNHISGVGPANKSSLPLCPNCSRNLFPVFDLDCSDPKIIELQLWPDPRIIVFVCASCALYMRPYWIEYDKNIRIIGGERDGGRILQDVAENYTARTIQLVKLDTIEFPTTEEYSKNLDLRKIGSGIYHQIGGLPFRGGYDEIECTNCHGPMKYAGCIDYDDLHVPLYENDGQPVALIIGDYDCLNWFTCCRCKTIGVKWNY